MWKEDVPEGMSFFDITYKLDSFVDRAIYFFIYLIYQTIQK